MYYSWIFTAKKYR